MIGIVWIVFLRKPSILLEQPRIERIELVPCFRLAPVEHDGITEAIRSFIERWTWGWILEGDTVVVIGKKDRIE